mmetsp:Transcript_2787/g.5905  ORF Transcript_2787/g.5905 Transcript_2787/m.5905 type:complete len:497 (+) Transcript_2787:1103-2593(+)
MMDLDDGFFFDVQIAPDAATGAMGFSLDKKEGRPIYAGYNQQKLKLPRQHFDQLAFALLKEHDELVSINDEYLRSNTFEEICTKLAAVRQQKAKMVQLGFFRHGSDKVAQEPQHFSTPNVAVVRTENNQASERSESSNLCSENPSSPDVSGIGSVKDLMMAHPSIEREPWLASPVDLMLKSAWWLAFHLKDDRKEIFCNLCGAKLVYDHKNAANDLKNHLKSHHPDAYGFIRLINTETFYLPSFVEGIRGPSTTNDPTGAANEKEGAKEKAVAKFNNNDNSSAAVSDDTKDEGLRNRQKRNNSKKTTPSPATIREESKRSAKGRKRPAENVTGPWNIKKKKKGGGPERDTDPFETSDLLGRVRVGTRISVYWENYRQSFAGVVKEIGFPRKKSKGGNAKASYFVHYDDGDQLWEDLTGTKFEILRPTRRGDVASQDSELAKVKVGCRVDVWWANEQEYFSATVVGFNATKGEHELVYDDSPTKYKTNLLHHLFRVW